MNLRNVLRTYALLRQLSDDESALLTTLRGMNDSERELLVESLQPEKATMRKKAIKKAASSGSRSPRASNLAATLGKNLAQQRRVAEDGPRCTYAMGDGVPCDSGEYSPIHDKSLGYLNYHPFVSSSSARPAAGRSSTNGDEVSSEIVKEIATSVVGAAVNE